MATMCKFTNYNLFWWSGVRCHASRRGERPNRGGWPQRYCQPSVYDIRLYVSIRCQFCSSNSLIVALHIGFWHPYRNIFALVDELGISPFTGWNKAAYYSTEGLAVISLLYFCAFTCFCSPVRCCNGLSNEWISIYFFDFFLVGLLHKKLKWV